MELIYSRIDHIEIEQLQLLQGRSLLTYDSTFTWPQVDLTNSPIRPILRTGIMGFLLILLIVYITPGCYNRAAPAQPLMVITFDFRSTSYQHASTFRLDWICVSRL